MNTQTLIIHFKGSYIHLKIIYVKFKIGVHLQSSEHFDKVCKNVESHLKIKHYSRFNRKRVLKRENDTQAYFRV